MAHASRHRGRSSALREAFLEQGLGPHEALGHADFQRGHAIAERVDPVAVLARTGADDADRGDRVGGGHLDQPRWWLGDGVASCADGLRDRRRELRVGAGGLEVMGGALDVDRRHGANSLHFWRLAVNAALQFVDDRGRKYLAAAERRCFISATALGKGASAQYVGHACRL